MDNSRHDESHIAAILTGVVVGGIIGGLTAAIFADPRRRQQFAETITSLDETTLELRPYIAERISAYGRAVEKEMKKSAEELTEEAKSRSRAIH